MLVSRWYVCEHLKLTTHDSIRFCVTRALRYSSLILAFGVSRHCVFYSRANRRLLGQRYFLTQARFGISVKNAQQQLSDFDDWTLKQPIERIAEVGVEAMFERYQTDNEVVNAWSKFSHNKAQKNKQNEEERGHSLTLLREDLDMIGLFCLE